MQWTPAIASFALALAMPWTPAIASFALALAMPWTPAIASFALALAMPAGALEMPAGARAMPAGGCAGGRRARRRPAGAQAAGGRAGDAGGPVPPEQGGSGVAVHGSPYRYVALAAGHGDTLIKRLGAGATSSGASLGASGPH